MNDSIIMEMYKKYEPFFSNWYLKRYIGEGGFAKVFEIVRNDFGKEYTSALKIVTVSKSKSEINTMRSEGMTDGEIREYLHGIVEDTVREIQLMYELKGKGNIVGYEDHAVMEHEDGMGWDILIKMEYLTSLSTYIRQNKGMLAKQDIIKLGIDICKALEACQKYNIIHRDIKADNIFISDDGDYKLGDFGIARVIERKDQTLSKKGTSAYMAPEVYKGQTYTSAVDIYSLGIVLYRLLNNNRAPFLPEYPKPISLDDRDRALMLRMSGERFPKPSQSGKSRLTEIVLKACAYRPEDRYSSPGFMRQELEALLLDEDELAAKEMIMIYEEGRSDTTSSRQSSVSSHQGNAASGHGNALPSGQGVPAASPDKEAATATGGMPAEGIASQNTVSEDGATEVLRGEATEALRGEATEVLRSEATEVLRGEATEVLRAEETEVLQSEPVVLDTVSGADTSAPVPGAKTPTTQQEVKVLCKNCGGVIERDKPFCPLCGAKQEEAPGKTALEKLQENEKEEKDYCIKCGAILHKGAKNCTVCGTSQEESAGSQNKVPKSFRKKESAADKLMAIWETQKTLVIGGICAAILAIAVIIGVSGSSTKNNTTQGSLVTNNSPSPTEVQVDGPWGNNVLMKEAETDFVLGSDIPRDKIITITFLDTLEEMPTTARDVSADKNGRVMAWTVSISGGYDLYIAGEGGVAANANSSYLFCGYENLEHLYLNGSFHTETATDMNHMFHGCSSLTSVDVSSFDTSNVTDMTFMFSLCSSLTSVDVSGFDTSNVVSMNYVFTGCSSLTSVDVSGFNTSNVMGMSYMFYGCTSLTSVNLSNFTSSQIEKMRLPSNVTVISQGGSSSSSSPSPKPAETSPSPSPSPKPAESAAPTQTPKPVESAAPTQTPKPAESAAPAQTQNPDPSGPPPGGGSGEQPAGPPR